MALKVDYYTSLLRAVGGLDRDAYAARGAVYEREHKALMRLLYSADPPRSEVEIEREQMAFRDAVRRVEFGDDGYAPPLDTAAFEALPEEEPEPAPPVAAPVVPLRATTAPRATTRASAAQAAAPASVAPRTPSRTSASTRAPATRAPEPPIPMTPDPAPPAPAAPVLVMPAPAKPAKLRPPAIPASAPRTLAPPTVPQASEPDWPEEPPVEAQFDPAEELLPAEADATADAEPMLEPEAVRPGEAAEPEAPAPEPRKRKPLKGMLVGRMLLAVLLLGLGALGYGQATGEFELPWVSELVGDGTLMQLARDPNAQQAIVVDADVVDQADARAVGKAVWRVRSEPAEGQGAATSVLQLDLEIPQRRLAMTMSMRPEAAGSAMSHLVEIRFLREDRTPDADIANIGNLYMNSAEQTRGTALSGRVMRVAPGVFLFGLGGLDVERERNLSNLKDLPWIDIPLTYRNGARGLLAVEKGAAGERAINDVLAAWGK
jgi:hypothetical protein